jgi:hypothetical protein
MQHCMELEQQVQQSITHSQQLIQAVLREVFEKKEKRGIAEVLQTIYLKGCVMCVRNEFTSIPHPIPHQPPVKFYPVCFSGVSGYDVRPGIFFPHPVLKCFLYF